MFQYNFFKSLESKRVCKAPCYYRLNSLSSLLNLKSNVVELKIVYYFNDMFVLCGPGPPGAYLLHNELINRMNHLNGVKEYYLHVRHQSAVVS